MRRFYRSRAARLLPPPPGRAPQTQTQIQIQLLHPLRAHTLQFCQGDTMILSYSIPAVALTGFGRSLTLNVLLADFVMAAPWMAHSGQAIRGRSEEHRCPNAPFNPKCAGSIAPIASAPE